MSTQDTSFPGITSLDVPGNAYLEFLLASLDSEKSVEKFQLTDSTAAVQYGKLEQEVNEYWYNPQANSNSPAVDKNGNPISPSSDWYTGTQGNIQFYIDGLNKAIAAQSDNTQVWVAGWNAMLQNAQTKAQQSVNKADSTMQLANTQVNNDSTNIQSLNQLITTMNMMGFIAQLLAKG